MASILRDTRFKKQNLASPRETLYSRLHCIFIKQVHEYPPSKKKGLRPVKWWNGLGWPKMAPPRYDEFITQRKNEGVGDEFSPVGRLRQGRNGYSSRNVTHDRHIESLLQPNAVRQCRACNQLHPGLAWASEQASGVNVKYSLIIAK